MGKNEGRNVKLGEKKFHKKSYISIIYINEIFLWKSISA